MGLESKPFLQLQDEIELRLHFRDVLKEEGERGLLLALGEIGAYYLVGLEIYQELLDEKIKKMKGQI